MNSADRTGSALNPIWLYAGVVALAAAVRVIVLLKTQNGIDFHFNAYDQPLFTWYDWMRSDRRLPMPGNPPLYYFLLRLAFTFFGFDAVNLPRFISLFFGVASVAPVMLMTRRIFGDRSALFAGVGAAVYPLAVRLSVVSLEVTLFHFCVLMSVLSLMSSDDRKERTASVLPAALWLNFACAARFEGWLLIPFMTLLCWRRSFKKAFLFGAAASAFPVFWMIANKVITGDPFSFAATSAVVQGLHLEGMGLVERARGWPSILARTWTVPSLLIFHVGIISAVKERKGLEPGVLSLGLLFLFILFTVRGTMALNETKYIALVPLLLAPFLGRGVAWIGDRFARPGLRIAASLAALLIVCGNSAAVIAEQNRLFAPPDDVLEICRFLRTVPESEGKVLLGVGFQGFIIVNSDLPYDRFVLVPGDDATGHRSAKDFMEILQKNAPCLLVHDLMPDNLDFQTLVPIDGKKTTEARLGGYDFRVRFKSENGQWMILAVRRLD